MFLFILAVVVVMTTLLTFFFVRLSVYAHSSAKLLNK